MHTISFDKMDDLPEEVGHKEEPPNAKLPSNASPRDHTNGILPMTLPDIQKSLQSLYEYNIMLRDQLVATQSTLDAFASSSEPMQN